MSDAAEGALGVASHGRSDSADAGARANETHVCITSAMFQDETGVCGHPVCVPVCVSPSLSHASIRKFCCSLTESLFQELLSEKSHDSLTLSLAPCRVRAKFR